MAQEFYKGHLINFSSSNGYPTFWDGKRNVLIHRHVWECHNGKIPEGYEIHHKDKNRRNYNLDNLELIKSTDHHRKHALENNLGKCNKGKLKLYSSGFCKGATPVILTRDSIIIKFNSVTEASRFLGIKRVGDVSRVLTGKRKTIKGWRCEYATA